MGLVEDVRSSHLLLLFLETNKVNVPFSIATSKKFDLTFPILVNMYANEIYAPVKLKVSGLHQAFDHAELRLIRIQESIVHNNKIKTGNGLKNIVKLTYRNVGSARIEQKDNVLANFMEQISRKE
ncbi:hypothetical protein OKW96_18625 [Sphingobacterium sp. KU25419]|nr:hypothetical protein OKW96_18625 [Sphingobacterium sp. KU25419]